MADGMMCTHLHPLLAQERPRTEYAAQQEFDLRLERIRIGALDALLVPLVNVPEAILARKGLLAVEDGQDIGKVDVLVLAVAADGELHSHFVRPERVKQPRHFAEVGVLGEGVADHKCEEVVENGAPVEIENLGFKGIA